MPALSKIAKHLGVSKTRAVQLKQEGMPVNTLRAAKLWRDKQEKKRAATNAKTANLQSAARGRPVKPQAPSKTGDSLRDALENTIMCADAAFKAYQKAVSQNLSTQSVRLSEHNKAIDARLKAEKMYREEMERRGVLVLKSTITDMCRRCMDTVLRRLRKLPSEAGPQCNQHEPLMAVKILEREVNEIIASGQKALNDI